MKLFSQFSHIKVIDNTMFLKYWNPENVNNKTSLTNHTSDYDLISSWNGQNDWRHGTCEYENKFRMTKASSYLEHKGPAGSWEPSHLTMIDLVQVPLTHRRSSACQYEFLCALCSWGRLRKTPGTSWLPEQAELLSSRFSVKPCAQK